MKGTTSVTASMNFSVREFRHIVGRYLHAHGCRPHLANPLREVLLSAQASGFDALTGIESSSAAIAGFTGGLTLVDTEVLDAAGQPAYAVAPDLVDRLLVAAHAAGRPVTMTVRNLVGAEALGHLGDYAAVRGLALTVLDAAGSEARVSAVLAPAAGAPADPRDAEGARMTAALTAGFDADVDQFWRLFHESNGALTPDSELSRQHAGAQVRDAEGNVIGEVDEESYLYIRSQAEQLAEVTAR